jgi:hypothetical protein
MYGAPAEQKIWKTDVTFLFLTSICCSSFIVWKRRKITAIITLHIHKSNKTIWMFYGNFAGDRDNMVGNKYNM